MEKRRFIPTPGKRIVDHLGKPINPKGADVPNLPYYHRLVRNREGLFSDPKTATTTGGKTK